MVSDGSLITGQSEFVRAGGEDADGCGDAKHQVDRRGRSFFRMWRIRLLQTTRVRRRCKSSIVYVRSLSHAEGHKQPRKLDSLAAVEERRALGGSPPSVGKWLQQLPIDLIVVLRGPDSSCISACWRVATEADGQGAEITTSKAARNMASRAQCRRTAGASLCIFD